jgi:tripartite-type tricarboxylate transporter receptor subunit TctC
MTEGESMIRVVMNSRRTIVVALATLAWHVPTAPWAQSYPAKPVRYVVPFPAGASPDLIARLVTERFSRIWGQQVLVENRSGAGGTVGAAFAAKAPADGYTLFQCNIASSAIAESLYAKMPYDQQRDFAPISLIGTSPSVLVVHPSMPARSLQEFIAYAKANPGKLSYGTSAAGTSPQLAMELFKVTAKIDVVHVAYKGAPQALSDVVGGQIPCSAQTAPAVLPAIQSGRVRALAVTSLKRNRALPDVPTLDEIGLKGYEVVSFFGLAARAGTPRETVMRLNTALNNATRTPKLREILESRGADLVQGTPEDFTDFIKAEIAKFAPVIKRTGVQVE